MNALSKRPSAPDPLQASSVPRTSARQKSGPPPALAPALAEAAGRISALLELNPGRMFSRADLAQRFGLDERLIKDALDRLRAAKLARTVTTAERGMGKFRYRWKECPA
jgi:hypothetical protein